MYSREMLSGLTAAHPDEEFLFCYRSHRFLGSYREKLPPNAVRRLLIDKPPGDVFHALNQRVEAKAARTICTFHDLFVMTGEYSTAEFRARFTDQAKRAAEMSDVIIAVSQFTSRQLRELLQVSGDRIRVVHHGVRIPPAIGDSEREDLVLTVGAIQKRKNVARLVKAFEQMPKGWRLTIAGSPDGFGAEEELRAVEESPRRADIDVPGYVSASELERLYRRAKIFAFPSLDEGFGMPVLDAMARGIAVITSNRSAMPEVAGDAAVFVDPCDVDQIATALMNLSEDDEARADFVKRGRARAAQFTWESAVEKTWRVYHEVR